MFQRPSIVEAETSGVQLSQNTSNNIENAISDIYTDSTLGNSMDNISIPLRRKFSLPQFIKKTLENKANELSETECNSQIKSQLDNLHEHSINVNVQSPSTSQVNYSLSNNFALRNSTENIQNPTSVTDSTASQPTQSSAAESEIDLDNISMLSDESSFTTNDYSSSQNEIISDDDCIESAVGLPNRTLFQSNSNRHAALFRSNGMQNQGNTGFINNLQVINNNFYTILLNNGSYEENSFSSHNIPSHERNGNYQRRNTKNNNSQLNNNCQASSSANFEDHENGQHSNSMHSNFQRNSCKNTNRIPIDNTSIASSSCALPVSSIFTVANNSPHKYSVKNTNISNNIPVGAKEVSTANLASRSSLRMSTCVNNINGTEENSQARQDATRTDDSRSNNASPVNAILEESAGNGASSDANAISSQSSHPLITKSSSNRMQKIQNADCIQNSTSSYTLTPSASALCKTNSFPLCNYIQSIQATDKGKLIKYNANPTGVGQRMIGENEVQAPHYSQTESVGDLVTNDTSVNFDRNQVSTVNTREDISANCRTDPNIEQAGTHEPRFRESLSDITSESTFESEGTHTSTTTSQNIINNVCNNYETNQCHNNSSSYDSICPEESRTTVTAAPVEQSTSFEVDNNYITPANVFQFTAQNIPSTLNNLNNNTTNTIPATTTSQNICSLTNNLHKNKKSNLNQLGRRNIGKEDKVFTIGKVVSSPPSTAITSDTSGQGSYQMINNSIERNFNKLNTCSQEINDHKSVKTDQSSKRNRKSKKPHSEQFGGRYYSEEFTVSNITNSLPSTSNSVAGSSSSYVENNSNVTSTSANSTTTLASNSTNVFQNMNNAMHSNQNKTLFNNRSHSMIKMDSSDKNISNVFNRKDLVGIKQNNCSSQQEHSNIRRSNSLNVKINDLAAGSSSSQLSDSKSSTRKSIIKSNSFTIRNNICEAGTSQRSSEERNYSNNINRAVSSKDSTVGIPNQTASNFHVRDGVDLEQFRLEEASNENDMQYSCEDNNALANEILDFESQNDPLEGFSGLILNNSFENAENHQGGISSNQIKPGSSNSGSGTTSSPQMIHNNIEPRCKKNKKCNEERGPLKPINSENKRK